MVVYGIDACIAVTLQKFDQFFGDEPGTGLYGQAGLRECGGGGNALKDATDRGDYHEVVPAGCCKPAEGCHPFAGDFRAGRDAVIGHAIPAGEQNDVGIGRKKGETIPETCCPAFIEGDVQKGLARAGRLVEAGQNIAVKALGYVGELPPAFAGDERGEIGQRTNCSRTCRHRHSMVPFCNSCGTGVCPSSQS